MKALAQWEEFSFESTNIQSFILTLCLGSFTDWYFPGDLVGLYFIKTLSPSSDGYCAFSLPVYSRALETPASQVKWFDDLKWKAIILFPQCSYLSWWHWRPSSDSGYILGNLDTFPFFPLSPFHHHRLWFVLILSFIISSICLFLLWFLCPNSSNCLSLSPSPSGLLYQLPDWFALCSSFTLLPERY